MSKSQVSRKGMAIIIVFVVLLISGGIAFAVSSGRSEQPVSESTGTETGATTPAVDDDENADDDVAAPAAPAVDLASLNSIAVEPLGVTVYYTKGTPAFDFAIKKAADRTEYVEFTAPSLVGTKCTDDQGLFASIIKNPSTNDAQTISQTTKVGGDTYGLSLAGASCADDAALLVQYQDGFKAGFSSLAAL